MPEYEIHVSRNGRWQIEGADASQDNAIAQAKKRVSMAGVEGVRVVLEGRGAPQVLFEQQGKADTGVITVGTLDAAPQRCETSADLYGSNARAAMAKLFRNYTTKMNLTVSEILYNG